MFFLTCFRDFITQFQCKYLKKINISENEQFCSLAIPVYYFTDACLRVLTVMLVAEQLNVKVRCL